MCTHIWVVDVRAFVHRIYNKNKKKNRKYSVILLTFSGQSFKIINYIRVIIVVVITRICIHIYKNYTKNNLHKHSQSTNEHKDIKHSSAQNKQ